MQRWRLLDREVQNLGDRRCRRAQTVVDIAEDTRRIAARRGSDPVDDLFALYMRLSGDEARTLVTLSMVYLRADAALDRTPRRR